MTTIPAAAIWSEIRRLLNFPRPEVCRHYVAVNLLNVLEQHGEPMSVELIDAVIRADDETALNLLPSPSPRPPKGSEP